MQKFIKKMLIEEQRKEITSYIIYRQLSKKIKSKENAEILKNISDDEFRHYEYLKGLTGRDIKPDYSQISKFKFIATVFGLTFGMKLLEKSEKSAQKAYDILKMDYPDIESFLVEEEKHEKELINMISEEKLNYIGSIVLGLNDALVELTGALAGYTFAFANSKVIALTGLITGISASFSMAASEYLSNVNEGNENAKKSSLYTGVAYIITVILLTLPYLLIQSPVLSLTLSLSMALIIIAGFNYYVAIVRDEPFKKRFFEMAAISLGVSIISFAVGIVIKSVLGVEI